MARTLYTVWIVSILILSCGSSFAHERTDSLLSDFDKYVEYLTETHPDPYTSFGGKPFFYLRVSDMRSALQSNPHLNAAILADSLTSLAAGLGDGHTVIYNNAGDESDMYAFGHIFQANDSLFLASLHRDNSRLLGARIEKIGGIGVNEALKIAMRNTSSENRFGPLGQCAYSFRPVSRWHKIFPGMTEGVSLEVITVTGDTVDYEMPIRPSSEFQTFEYARVPDYYDCPHGLFEYKTIGINNNVMVMSVPTVMARENLEYCYRNGLEFMNTMRGLYGYLGRPMPSDTIEALNGFPSYQETFRKMLNDMKKRNIPYLVIDLRGNGGGWTPIVLPTLMQLYGDKYVMSTYNRDAMDIRRISPLYLEKMNMTIGQLNERWGTNLNEHDYVFERRPEIPLDSIEFYRKDIIDNFMASDTEKSLLRKSKGKPVYEPKRVFVLTDPGTFSAAFHYTFFLRQAGAEVVGVTSSQAPNTFMEQTYFKLPYTGIDGSISNYQQIMLAPSDPRSKEFTPDIPVDYSIFRKYGFNSDATVSYLLELLGE